MAKNSMVVYRPKSSKQAIRSLGIGALQAMIANKGEDWVLQQVQNGMVALSGAARAWWTSSTVKANPSNMMQSSAPASLGVAVRGNARLNGNTRIKHRELIMSPTLTGVPLGFRINPVDSVTFPYLSTIASMYDKYKFHSLKFTLVSSTPTTSGGRWYMAWDPDSQDDVPVENGAFMAMTHSCSMSSWQSGELGVPSSQELFTDYFGGTLKDFGKFWVNAKGATILADLFVEYDVSLIAPNVTSPSAVLKGAYQSLIGSGTFGSTLGADVIQQANPAAPKKFRLAPGYWFITSQIQGSTASTASDWTATSLDNTGVSLKQQAATADTGKDVYRSLVVVSQGGVEITIGDTAGTTLVDQRCSLVITPVSPNAASDLLDAYN